MYNQEIKERFLTQLAQNSPKSSVDTARQSFEKLSPYEEKREEDIAQMDQETAMDALLNVEAKSYSALRNVLVSARRYINWAIENHVFVDPAAGFLEITETDLEPPTKAATQYFKDEEDLLAVLHSVRDFHEGYPEIPYLLLSWLGIDKRDIVAMKEDQIDLDSRTIKDASGNVVISGFSNAIKDALEAYVSCDRVFRDHGANPAWVIKDKSIDTFIKRFFTKDSNHYGEPPTTGQLDSRVNEAAKVYKKNGGKKKIAQGNVLRSGQFFRLAELEKAQGIDVTDPKHRDVFRAVVGDIKRISDVIKTYHGYRQALHPELESRNNP